MAYNVEKEYILQTEIILLKEVTLLLEYILQTEVRSRNLPKMGLLIPWSKKKKRRVAQKVRK